MTETTAETTTRAAPALGSERDVVPRSRTEELVERLRWAPSSLRARIVAWFIGVLVVSTVGFVVVTYEVLEIRLDQRIDLELRQEAAELRRLRSSNDPQTGEPFASVRRLFTVYLVRNVPSPNEALITFLAGEPFLRSRPVVPYRLDRDPELVARWAGLTAPDRGGVSTPAGRVEYLAVPVNSPSGETGGVFVAAFFRDRAKSASEDSAILAAERSGWA